MPKSLEKTRKKIGKKKGDISALHENSRDCQKLRRAGMRDNKLAQVAAARKRHDQHLIKRAAFFQEAVRKSGSKLLQLDAIQALIEMFVQQHDAEFNSLKKERRPGRPATAREDLLRMKIAVDRKEHEDGFFLPDLMDTDNVMFFGQVGRVLVLFTNLEMGKDI